MLPYALSHRKLETIEEGVLTVAAFDKFHPISFYENGKLEGIEVKLMEEYAKAVGLTLKLVRVGTWDKLWDKPRLKQADVSIGGIANSLGREHKDTEWSMPYYYVRRSVITLKKPPEKARFKPVSAITKSTGYIDTNWRLGETFMTSMQPGKGYIHDLKLLRRGALKGVMYGDQVSRSILQDERKKKRRDLTMRSWDIVPTIVPLDGETFSFPTRAGSGLAASLSSFLAEAQTNGMLKKWCKQFHLKYPVLPGTHNKETYPDQVYYTPKRKELKPLLQLFLLSPDYASARKKYPTVVKQGRAHMKSLFDGKGQSVARTERLEEALKRTDVLDYKLFLSNLDLFLSKLSAIISDKYTSEGPVWVANKTMVYNLEEGDTRWFDFIKYVSMDAEPLVTYSKNTAHVNTTLAWKHVRENGNNKKAYIDEVVHIAKLLIPQVLEKESGLKNAVHYLQ